jgi:uncharacterized protein YndB with AHSA1/START domain
MTDRSAVHSTFAIERTYDASPARVFEAWADPAAKRRWFGAPAQGSVDHELDFRVGGRELNRGGPPGGPVFTYEAIYYDIVPGERIVYAYDMYMGDTRISVSVATVEFSAAGTGTRLLFTEQGAFLDGHDTPAQREHGTGELLGKLAAALKRQPATP